MSSKMAALAGSVKTSVTFSWINEEYKFNLQVYFFLNYDIKKYFYKCFKWEFNPWLIQMIHQYSIRL